MVVADVVTPIERSAFSSRDPEETTEFFRQAYVGNRTAFAHVAPEGGSAPGHFQRHQGITPMAYPRRTGLEGAHRELQASNPGSATVAATALRWGFSHAAGFSSAYRKQYGVLPRHRLRT